MMQFRRLGKTGFSVSTVSFGAWAIGGSWGAVDDDESLRALHRAIDLGVNFIDTADVYGDGRSERLVARVCRERSEPVFVATKAGRRLPAQTRAGYEQTNLTAFVERSLKNLAVEAIDLLQLHCPPTDVYYAPEVFGILDDLVAAGKVRHYGVSVERVEEALKAIEYPNVATVQIVYNLFRQRPADRFLAEAARQDVGVLARLPLSSGMLAGKMSRQSAFSADDHRSFNREGAAFDRGETFSGVDFETGLALVETLRPMVPPGTSMAAWAIRWILMDAGVTCAIPGGRRIAQVDDNVAAADLPPLPAETMAAIRALYDARIRPLVHQYW